jgi:biofilm PGA synthesis protein PgaD
MKEIIINQPHLQSLQQRITSAGLKFISWLLWLYFLLPLFTLGGWLLGWKNLSNEIRWFGGYKTLQELLLIYGMIILVIAVFWVFWTFFLSWLHGKHQTRALAPVSDTQLSEAFKVGEAQLHQARAQQCVTVHFDSHAVITQLDSGA